ncbi:MAG: short-chain dehydrogenase, partial [Chloroflexi bacterium]|nr:short-chain dehydrogenase [Chloroflexota bacterium]
GYTLNLYSHAEAVRILQGTQRWGSDELFDLFPKTLSAGLTPPPLPPKPGEEAPKRRTQLLQEDKSSWQEIAPGVKYWRWQEYFETKRG